MTVPLTEVYFPSVVVCNINQVRKYFRKKTTYTLNKCSFFTKHDFEFLLLRFGPYMSNLRKKNIFFEISTRFPYNYKQEVFEVWTLSSFLRFENRSSKSWGSMTTTHSSDRWGMSFKKLLLIWELPFYENQMQWQQSYQLSCSGQLGMPLFLKKIFFFFLQYLTWENISFFCLINQSPNCS